MYIQYVLYTLIAICIYKEIVVHCIENNKLRVVVGDCAHKTKVKHNFL